MGRVAIILAYAVLLVVLVRPRSQGPTLVKNAGSALSSVINASSGGGTF